MHAQKNVTAKMTDGGKKAAVTQEVSAGIGAFPVRTPTLPPATHTNTYIVGSDRLTLFDPASPYVEEQSALDATLDRAPATVERLVLTHHHVDHVSGAMHLRDRLHIPIAAHRLTALRVAGRIVVDELLDDGQVLDCDGRRLRAVWTPGHAPGHLCFFDETSHAMLVGDMVASIGTIIVAPADDGDMAAYLSSLRLIASLNPSVLLPAHGPPIHDPQGHLAHYIQHRLQREAKVLGALGKQPRTVDELVPLAYPEISPTIYGLAAQSLLAHLIKLGSDGKAAQTDTGWAAI